MEVSLFGIALGAAWLFWFVGLLSCLLALVIASVVPALGHDNHLAFGLPWGGEIRTSVQAGVMIIGWFGLLLLGMGSTLLVHRLPQSPSGSGLQHVAYTKSLGRISPEPAPTLPEKDQGTTSRN